MPDKSSAKLSQASAPASPVTKEARPVSASAQKLTKTRKPGLPDGQVLSSDQPELTSKRSSAAPKNPKPMLSEASSA